MLLSEALINRKNAQKSVEQALAKYTESAVRPLSADKKSNLSIDSVLSKVEEFTSLSLLINNVNNKTKVGALTIMEAISKRDGLKLKITYLDKIITGIKQAWRYNSPTNLLEVIGTPLSGIEAARDQAAKELRELDVDIQKVNWSTEI